MSYDPLFRSWGEPDYFWCSYWDNRSGIPFEELPHAGPDTLPPPIMEGQMICFRLYDDTTADYLITANSIEANGLPLQWVETRREKVPRAMVGTHNIKAVAEELVQDIASLVVRRRETWLRERFVNRVGEHFSAMSPEQFKHLCKAHNLTFKRRVGFKDGHEELWINGNFDSTFTP